MRHAKVREGDGVRHAGRRNYEQATPTDWKWEHVRVEALWDIREELQTLNKLLHCKNFLEMPTILRRIEANTKRKPRAKKGKT